MACSRWESPRIWLVHVISPSTYAEPRFARLLEDLAAATIGVICCPSAAISMRQYRTVSTPTFNSIARVLEMLGAGQRPGAAELRWLRRHHEEDRAEIARVARAA